MKYLKIFFIITLVIDIYKKNIYLYIILNAIINWNNNFLLY